MFDYRLKVFYTVAKRLNFTKAAKELFISQPAVSKHIHEIESFYKVKLFERNSTRIKLTQAGEVLLRHTENLINIYRNIDFDLAALCKNVKGTFKIGASTTVAQYFLPKYLASFKNKFPDVTISMTSNNTENIENLSLQGKIDFGIVEGQSKRHLLKYESFVKDEIVLCARTANVTVKKSAITFNELQKLGMVVRESGSGSLDVIISALKNSGFDYSQLKIDMVLESTESIKSYLLHSNSFAFLSIHSIFKELKSGEMKIVDVKGLNIERHFYFITQQGDTHSLQEVFLKHLLSYKLNL